MKKGLQTNLTLCEKSIYPLNLKTGCATSKNCNQALAVFINLKHNAAIQTHECYY